MIEVKVMPHLKRVEVSRGGKVFTSGHVYNMRHLKAIESKFKQWDAQGWPPKEIE